MLNDLGGELFTRGFFNSRQRLVLVRCRLTLDGTAIPQVILAAGLRDAADQANACRQLMMFPAALRHGEFVVIILVCGADYLFALADPLHSEGRQQLSALASQAELHLAVFDAATGLHAGTLVALVSPSFREMLTETLRRTDDHESPCEGSDRQRLVELHEVLGRPDWIAANEPKLRRLTFSARTVPRGSG